MVRIFGTLGPSCESFETLKAMYSEGMNGIRLNLSHCSLAESADKIDTVRKAADAAGKDAGILIDMQGPELRLGVIPEPFILEDGQSVQAGCLSLPLTVSQNLCEGAQLLIDDGKLLLTCSGGDTLEVIRGGTVRSRKSVAIEGMEFDTPAVTSADLENLSNALRYGVSYVMQPFVRGRKDLETLRCSMAEAGAGSLPVFAKIENLTGYQKIDEIIPFCNELVIARGDLGNAIPLWVLPSVQKRIAARCRQSDCPFTVVTQMLASMENSPVPTRAEVCDIFNAVLDGASSVMLTGETAVGQYPVEAIKYMYRTVCEAEEYCSRS